MKWFWGVLLFAVFIIAVGFSYFRQDGTSSATNSSVTERVRILKNIAISGVSRDLAVNYTMKSESMRHFPDRGISELVSPHIVQKHKEGDSRIIQSDQGEYNENLDTVTLMGNVVITEYPDNGSDPIVTSVKVFTVELGEM